MPYNQNKMKKLLELDRFLNSTFEDIRAQVGCDDAAMQLIFETYIMREPIFKNAYMHLT